MQLQKYEKVYMVEVKNGSPFYIQADELPEFLKKLNSQKFIAIKDRFFNTTE